MHALLVLDVQVGLVHGQERLWRCAELLHTLNTLMERARDAGAPIYLARHVGMAGSPFAADSPLTALAPELQLQGTETVFEKRRPNAFVLTGLAESLRERGVTGLVVSGLKTQYCVDSTCRAARDLGFDTVLVADGHTCSDTPWMTAEAIIKHHNATLDGAFCRLVEAEAWRFDPEVATGR